MRRFTGHPVCGTNTLRKPAAWKPPLSACQEPCTPYAPTRRPRHGLASHPDVCRGLCVGSNMAGMADLPSGVVTFLFTDIEGSTELVDTLAERYPALLQ